MLKWGVFRNYIMLLEEEIKTDVSMLTEYIECEEIR
jgi:hypothetical protein